MLKLIYYWSSCCARSPSRSIKLTSDFFIFNGFVCTTFRFFFFFQAEDGIRDIGVTGVQTCALPISDLPVVMLSPGEASHAGITVFFEDQELGARLAVRHLVRLGHREIAHLAGSQEWLDGQVRLRGWQAELEAHRLRPGPIRYGDWSGESAYRLGQEMVAEGLPTSIFIASDLMALGFLRALYEAGASVPRDISVVGFDDNEFAPQVHPPLTTVRQSFQTVGARCMEILLGLIAGDDVDTTPAVPQLIVRA